MKLSSIALFFALVGVGAHAVADDANAPAATSQPPVESYAYGMKLDIQKIISITDTADQCGPVPTQMTYEDSQGKRHVMQYQIMGTGCSNG
ncbi:DUF2790 domain-containing protein [Pseudomonas frederiksbergensis]|uniref:DUF2790 domain-containing protein n=1 Tax=Pseudomonas frederiksbergensis TaxID=104087 RepID=A0A423KR57_9PSED|nr:DUF2790 domain-containing protein [Pseudomonas frederiksbergensis]RON57851.1 hypothetical protein BK665_03075 [Pseudomonas frederiksbergensis]